MLTTCLRVFLMYGATVAVLATSGCRPELVWKYESGTCIVKLDDKRTLQFPSRDGLLHKGFRGRIRPKVEAMTTRRAFLAAAFGAATARSVIVG